MSLSATLERLKQFLLANPDRTYRAQGRSDRFTASQFRSGLSREAIARKTERLPQPLPSELVELYQWHNGADDAIPLLGKLGANGPPKRRATVEANLNIFCDSCPNSLVFPLLGD